VTARARSVRRGALGLLSLGAVACAAPAARFATTDPNSEPPPRVPPGVAVDPVSRLPGASPRGSSDTSLLVLAAPRRLAAARGTVDRFFRALIAESASDVDALLSEQAQLDAATGRQPARGALRSRFLSLDYTALRGVPLYRESDVEIYRRKDSESLLAERSLPSDLAADQLFVRVRLSVSHAGKNRLLADEMGFFLRPERDSYRIVSIREDTPVP
jgi:hypothetical protein